MVESRRFILAIALSIAVFLVFAHFSNQPGQGAVKGKADSTAVARKGATAGAAAGATSAAASGSTTAVAPGTGAGATTSVANPTPNPSAANTAAAPAAPAAPPVAAETTTVVTRPDSGATFRISNVGAAPTAVVMNAYVNRVHPGKVDLGSGGGPVLRYALVVNRGQAVDLSAVPFQGSRQGDALTYRATVGNTPVALNYVVRPDSFVAHVTGSVAGAGDGSYLVVSLPTTFAATEPDTADDRNSLAFSFMRAHEAARSVAFKSLDPGEKQLVEGPISWIAAKSKYFVVGLLAPKNGPNFAEASLVGGARTSKVATTAAGTVVVPIHNGTFAFDMYAGPQEWRRLSAMGREFDTVNPYGWAFVRGLMQPIATSVIRVVLWMHRELKLSYGLVLIALGLIVRLLMWPLYQSSMRTSLKMQVLQPELQVVQDRYKDDPEKQRVEIMKVYQAHGMNPLSPLLGCLPSLLPMPILFALFFVFRNTIELRGVPFLWIGDLSARDPLYILPLIMGLSMYLVSWIGMRNAPPNPQTKMMGYMMPVMFTFFFWRAAAGLNLYYATQNLATLPQQWQLAHERTKMKPAGTAPVQGAPAQKAQTGAKKKARP
jgi:YidC/Oxa1 family membrane protein insertase